MTRSTSPTGSLPGFFILLIALSVPFWLAGFVVERSLPLPMGLPVSALMVVCPLAAAVILAYREGGRKGLNGLFAKIFDFTGIRPPGWYIPIVFLMPAVLLLSYAVMRATHMPLPEPDVPFRSIPVLFAVFFLAAVGEEAGWMGYAAGPMLARWSALQTGIMLGLVWAAWHIVPLVQSGRSAEWIGWWCAGTVALRVLTVWLYANTGKSVPAAVIFHAMTNVSDSLFPNGGSHYNPAVTGVILAAVAAIVTLAWGGETLAGRRAGR